MKWLNKQYNIKHAEEDTLQWLSLQQSKLLNKHVKTPFDMEIIAWLNYAIEEETECQRKREHENELAEWLQENEKAYADGTMNPMYVKKWEEI